MLLNSGIETLGDIVEIGAGKFGANTSLVYDGRSFSFGEQRSRIYRLANALYEMGVRRQHRVAILAQNSNAYVEVYAAGEVVGLHHGGDQLPAGRLGDRIHRQGFRAQRAHFR